MKKRENINDTLKKRKKRNKLKRRWIIYLHFIEWRWVISKGKKLKKDLDDFDYNISDEEFEEENFDTEWILIIREIHIE
jgi:hypothetical protein